MSEHPKVFISYSRDSSEHEQWVSELGTKLRHNDVNAILDQQGLALGTGLAQFMEVGVRDCDRVLVICTDNYVRKANNREGGVGYEIEIITAQLVQNLGTNKVIPIIRQASGPEKMPTCLGTRVYIDFTDDSQFDGKFDELLCELRQVPFVENSPLGKKSFAQLPSEQEVSPSDALDTQQPEIPQQVESASDVYSAAIQLARTEDVLGWRQLVKRTKPKVFKSLIQRRREGLAGKPPKGKEQFQAVDEAVNIISPLISVALVGVESKMEQFRDQKSTLYDLLHIVGWKSAGPAVWVEIALALGYVYHSLHGGLSLSSNQLDLALNLARVKIPDLHTAGHCHVWETDDLMGWSASLGDDYTEGWKYLVEAYERGWEWLVPIFGDKLEYRTSLVAYYMALNIHELAAVIASGRERRLEASSNPTSLFFLHTPLVFLSEEYYITERATSLLSNQEALTNLWTCLNVTREQMEDSWENWISASDKRWGMYEGQLNSRIHHNLTHIFRYFFEGL